MPIWTDSDDIARKALEPGTAALARTRERLERSLSGKTMTLVGYYERGLLTYREWLALATRREGVIGG